MSDDEVDNIAKLLEQLELEQEAELALLQTKHRNKKRQLLRRLTLSPKPKPKKVPLDTSIRSYNRRKIVKGDTVRLSTTASVGCKGDLAVVTVVQPSQIDLHVPRLNDLTWRKPHNIEHC